MILWSSGFFSGEQNNSPTEVARVTTEAPTLTETLTPTPEATLTPSETLEIALVVETLDAQAIIEQSTVDANSTASARATEFAVGTQSIIDQTATATQWTDTPTPNMTASIDAFRTQRAETETQAWIDSWTATPTLTNTPNITATLIAFRPQQNDDWIPIEQDFDGITMVLVPAGCFTIGSDDGDGDELNGNEICFDEPFWIDKYEVTNEQYGSTGCEQSSSAPNQPRNCVSWFDAEAHCQARDGRLPTEAEWEYTARGPDNLTYTWGNEFDGDNTIYIINSDGQSTTIGSLPAGASWVNAMDMNGNVYEWTISLYDDYPYEAGDGREDDTGERIDVYRVLRGGSFNNSSVLLRSAVRLRRFPSVALSYFGFRCARDYE